MSQLRHDAPAFQPRPQKVLDFRMSELSWEDLKNKRERRTSLHLRGLPRKMCMPGALEAAMRQHGLFDLVQGFKVMAPAGGGRLGCAVLTARSVDEVAQLAKFFHGRQFGASAPVAVSYASAQGSFADLLARRPKGSAEPMRLPTSELKASTIARQLTAEHAEKAELAKDGTYHIHAATTRSLSSLPSDASGCSDSPRSVSSPEPDCKQSSCLRPPPGLECYDRAESSTPPWRCN